MNIISKPRITKSDVATLVDLTLEAKSIVWLKNEMQFLVGEGLILINELSTTKLRSQLQALLSIMLEDL
jgi:hypothetical protein